MTLPTLPIPSELFICKIVLTGTDMITDGFLHWVIHGGKFRYTQSFFTKQSLNGFCIFCTEKFSFWIRPPILHAVVGVFFSLTTRIKKDISALIKCLRFMKQELITGVFVLTIAISLHVRWRVNEEHPPRRKG